MKNNIISFDIGSKTIGIATSKGIIASAYDTIRFEEYNFSLALSKLESVINDLQPTTIVVGYPINMNNTIGERAEMVDYFIELFLSKFKNYKDSDIIKIDERRTTICAKNILIGAGMRRDKQKEKKDSLAAQLILELYLEQKMKGLYD